MIKVELFCIVETLVGVFIFIVGLGILVVVDCSVPGAGADSGAAGEPVLMTGRVLDRGVCAEGAVDFIGDRGELISSSRVW